jgi:hypothetical protein
MLLVVLLACWWFVLSNPLLMLLRVSAEIGWDMFGNNSGQLISETPAGDWSLRVPVRFTMPESPQQLGPVKIHSVDFDVARTEAIAFTFSLPVYWAIILAAPNVRRNLRPLALGSIVVAILEAMLFLAFAEISAHNVAAQWSRQAPDSSDWFLRFAYYLVVNVIPYVAPFLIAVAFHHEFSGQIFWRVHPKAVGVSAHGGAHFNKKS